MSHRPIAAFTTQRLAVEDWTATLDVAQSRAALIGELAEILTDAALEHLPPPLAVGPGGIDAWIDARTAESDVLLVRQRNDDTLVGLMILAVLPAIEAKTDLHIGYILGERVWGQGLASELLRGFVTAIKGPIRLVAGVSTSNPASVRVLEKTGFGLASDQAVDGMLTYIQDID